MSALVDPPRTDKRNGAVALAGNPNSGKSTLFNALTGLRQKVANYPGVTVEKKVGRFRGLHGRAMEALDLPGTYSLDAQSPDEVIAREVLLGERSDTPPPAVIISVVDATNLERNLFLTSQLAGLGIPVLVALNMVDLAERRGLRIDAARLERQLGLPVIPTIAPRNHGLVALKAAVERALHQPPADFPTLDQAEERYAWIRKACAGVVWSPDAPRRSATDRIDAVLTHRVWGWIAFLGLMAALFYAIFQLAALPMDWIEGATAVVGDWLGTRLPDGDLRSLLVDGVVAGIGGVVVFLPQILILFFFLGLLEDSGYMARGAFIMDRLMAPVGLHGKSFIPLLSSFACAIPGVMAARTIEHRSERLLTIFVCPLMSCSARLPVYALMIAVLLPAGNVWAKAGIMLAMYALGIVAAFLTAWALRRTTFREASSMLLLEMPPYRRPSLRNTLLRMWERGRIFLTNAGTMILALSILLWAAMTYPKPANPDASPAEALSTSFAGQVGHALEPAIRPLGYDWKIGIGLIASLAAREAFVGTMAIVHNVGSDDADAVPLRDALRAERRSDGSPLYTPLVCLGLMVFYALSMQCLSTLAVVRRETNSWRWPIAQLVFFSALAYGVNLLVYQGGRLLGFQ